MKSFQLVLVVLVVCVSSTLALRCNRCIVSSSGGRCSPTVETCPGVGYVCVSASYYFPPAGIYSYFRRCIKPSDAAIIALNKYYTVRTCPTDLCN
ncbi:hypothetical protein EXN66_Car003944 [Channa argus]|uniref:UPAR/Ly6 domain-containing protein n=1 Tax=Channa argus TaxID=215402 RepID=A0A6G1PDF2_CHAAH|nr:hypothetical protein EXN66_Car003944 [Channa argus]